VRWLRTTKVPLLDHQGEVIGVFGCYEDITDRKHAEDALRESELRYRTLVDQAADGILVAGSDGRYLEVNTAACQMTGYDAAELRGMMGHDLVVPDESEQPNRPELLRQGVTVTAERRIRRKDGSILPVEVSSKLLPDGRMQAIVRDVTERLSADEEKRRLEEQLHHAQRLESLGRLAGGIAHDFNNLLTAILTSCDILRTRLERHDIEARELEQVQRASRRAAALTSQLLSFSRKQIIQPRVVDLNEIVEDTQRMLGRLIGEHIDLEVRLGEEKCLVLADPGQLDQILVNLAVNARDAMGEGGHLVIATRIEEVDDAHARRLPGIARGSHVALEVSDTGAGMPRETVEHLFEPFFTTKEQGKGTGLGLATVYGIVSRAGGTIDVDSEVGRGTRLTVYLPRAAGPIDTITPAQSWERAVTEGGTILLVEDEESVRLSATQILTAGGYRVLAATDGEHALRVYEAHDGPIDLLVTDVIMPRMGGPELAQLLRARAPGLKTLFVSGYTDDMLGDRGVVSPDVDLLHKPFSRRPLLDKVREVMASK
jgi:PAS domain S-box-containing protein